MAKDPVCGMQVNEQQANATAEYKGYKFYFCFDRLQGEVRPEAAAFRPADRMT